MKNVTYKVRIKNIIDEGKKRATYVFEKPKEFSWQEGSHISLALEEGLTNGQVNKDLMRKFSIATTLDEGVISISTRLDSSDSIYKKKLSTLCPGDQCYIYGCESKMPIRREDKNLVFISMGVGMATMRPIIRTYQQDQTGVRSVKNICVDRTGDHLYKDEISCDKSLNIDTLVAKSRGEFKDILDDGLSIDYNDSIFYIVGSNEFLKDTIKLLKDKNVRKENIMIDKSSESLEKYYNVPSYETMKVKDYQKFSSSFMPLGLTPGACSCGGNCTCK